MMRNLGFYHLLPHFIDVNSIKDLLKYSYELCWRVDLSYKIFSLEIYLLILSVGCSVTLIVGYDLRLRIPVGTVI